MLDKAEIERWERLTAAMLRHAAADDPAAFAQIVGILDDARYKLPVVAMALVDPAPGRLPYSWRDLADALGCTKSAAWQRFGPGRLSLDDLAEAHHG